jgi:hypothetical protein
MAPWDLAKLAVTGVGPLGDARHVGFLERESLDLLDLLISPLISAMHIQAVVAIGDAQRSRLGAVASQGLRCFPRRGGCAHRRRGRGDRLLRPCDSWRCALDSPVGGPATVLAPIPLLAATALYFELRQGEPTPAPIDPAPSGAFSPGMEYP